MNEIPEGTIMGPAWDWGVSSNPVTPGGANPQAQSWTDVLTLGLSKYADYRIAELQAQNAVPTESRVPSQVAAQGMGMNGIGGLAPLLILGGLAYMITQA